MKNAVSIKKIVRVPLNIPSVLGILCASLRQGGERNWKARAQRLKETRATNRKPNHNAHIFKVSILVR